MFERAVRLTARAHLGLASLVVGLVVPMDPAAAEIAGWVTRLQAQASATTAGETRPLSMDGVVNVDDIVRTGPGARLEVTLRDATRLVMGENGEVVVDDLIYRPDVSTRQMLVQATKGAFRFISGKARRFARSDLTVRTPVATIGVRGTDFWGGRIDGSYGVFLFEGSVEVTTSVGSAVLDRAGTGVSMTGTDAPPGPVIVWGQDKVRRAAATVTFQ